MQIDGAIEHGLMIDSCKDKELTEASLLHYWRKVADLSNLFTSYHIILQVIELFHITV